MVVGVFGLCVKGIVCVDWLVGVYGLYAAFCCGIARLTCRGLTVR